MKAGLTRVRLSPPSGQTCPPGCCHRAWRCRGSSRGWCWDDRWVFACLGPLLRLLENTHSKLISLSGENTAARLKKSTITCFSHGDIKHRFLWQIWMRLFLYLEQKILTQSALTCFFLSSQPCLLQLLIKFVQLLEMCHHITSVWNFNHQITGFSSKCVWFNCLSAHVSWLLLSLITISLVNTIINDDNNEITTN